MRATDDHHHHHHHGRLDDHDPEEHDIGTYYYLPDYGAPDVSTHFDFHPDHQLTGDERTAAIDAFIAAVAADGHDVRELDEQRPARTELERLRADVVDALAKWWSRSGGDSELILDACHALVAAINGSD